MPNQGGTPRGNDLENRLLPAAAVLPVLRSVAYRLRTDYITEPKLFNSTEAIAWAVAQLEHYIEEVDSGRAQSYPA